MRYAVAYLGAPSLAGIPYGSESKGGLYNDGRSNRAREPGRSPGAVPRIPPTAQFGRRGLETGDESTAIERCGALYHASLAAAATLNYANNNRESCDISVPLLNQVEGYHREAVGARDNACAGRPLRPYGADIMQR